MAETVTPTTTPAPPDNLVSMNCEALIVGRQLRHPIYDSSGLLLLAAGKTITPEFRDNILDRQVSSIRVHPDEVKNISVSEPPDKTSYISGDEELAEKLDAIIDEGFMTVVNSEAALIEQVAQHGTANYNQQKQLERVERNKESSDIVDNLLKNALHGRSVDFSQVTKVTAGCMADMTEDMDGSIASMVDSVRKDGIADHCVKMSLLGMALGVEMRLDATNVRNLGLAGLLHDWGMVRVPDEIRNAPRYLTSEERYHLKKHPIYTLHFLEKLGGISGVVPVVAYQVHESPNGNGYPQGRSAERIHIMARILSVADRYNALVSPRPFRPPLTAYAAMECLLRQAAQGEIDSDVVRSLLMVQSLFPIGSHVILSDGSMARVLRRNGHKFCHPIVRLIKDSKGKEVPEHSAMAIVDLSAAGLNVVQSMPDPGSNAVNLNQRILRMSDDYPEDEEMVQSDIGKGLANISSEEALRAASEAAENRAALEGSVTSLEYYSESQKKKSLEALEILDNSAAITARANQAKRNDGRVALRTVVTICLMDPRYPIVSLNSGRVVKVMTRDVSGNGVSFVCPDIMPQERILIGLHVNAQTTRWFLGDVVRVREISDTGFYEHAVNFRQSVVM